MKIETARLGLAVGVGSAILWTLCSTLVAVAPEASLATTRSLFHVASGGPVWGVTWGGFLVGLFVWGVGSGLFAWLCAGLYNRMLPARER